MRLLSTHEALLRRRFHSRTLCPGGPLRARRGDDDAVRPELPLWRRHCGGGGACVDELLQELNGSSVLPSAARTIFEQVQLRSPKQSAGFEVLNSNTTGIQMVKSLM